MHEGNTRENLEFLHVFLLTKINYTNIILIYPTGVFHKRLYD